MPKQFYILILLATCWVGLLVGCGADSDVFFARPVATASAPSRVSVNIIRVDLAKDVAESVTYFGKIVPSKTARLGFATAGKIESIQVQVGQQVQSGQTLATLFQEGLESEKLELEQAIENNQPTAALVQDDAGRDENLAGRLRRVEAELQRGKIEAPFEGVVNSVEQNESEFAASGRSLITVSAVSPLRIDISLPVFIARQLTIGQTIWADVDGSSVKTEVALISPVESAAGSRLVSCTSDQFGAGEGALGQTVRVRFILDSGKQGYWVPRSALTQETAGLWSLLQVENDLVAGDAGASPDPPVRAGVVTRRPVKILQVEGEWALVGGAISGSVEVIADGLHRIVAGQKVSVVDVTQQFSRPRVIDGDELEAVE